MVNPTWTIDGNVNDGGSNDKLTWEDHRFFTLVHNGKSFHGEVMKEALESNSLTVKINHRVFEVKKDHPLDALISEMGMDKPKIQHLKELIAPMPGRIVTIATKVGQALNVGDEILSLEA
ncbi:MAG: acetyl/propionyl-CoA carboxylase alpha subunit, partial [Flavobacteriaceae bacterium]